MRALPGIVVPGTVLVAVASLAACSSTDGRTAAGTPTSTSRIPGTTRSLGSGHPSGAAAGTSGGVAARSVPVGAPGAQAATTSPPAPVIEPPRPTAPAATTAGALDQRSLPRPTGWSTATGDGADGGYIPNGTWVNARDARSTAQEILGLGCRDVPAEHPWPRSALEGTYRGPGGADGTGEVLDFASGDEATQFASLYAAQAHSCVGAPDPVFTMSTVTTSPALVDRRVMTEDRTTWLEVVGVKGTRVTFLMLQEKSGPVPAPVVQSVVRDVT